MLAEGEQPGTIVLPQDFERPRAASLLPVFLTAHSRWLRLLIVNRFLFPSSGPVPTPSDCGMLGFSRRRRDETASIHYPARRGGGGRPVAARGQPTHQARRVGVLMGVAEDADINTVKALGLSVPPMLPTRADEVVE